MRDIIDDERQRLGSQGLAAQRVVAARHRQLRCDSIGRNHILALVTPHFRPSPLATRQPDFYHGLLVLGVDRQTAYTAAATAARSLFHSSM